MTEKNFSILRQEAIKKLLGERLISDQKTLVDLLKRECGIETNQPVLSRDLRRLGVVKKEIDGKLFYSLPTLDVTAELLKLAVIEINYNETMIVVKTHPGLAAFVGDYIDHEMSMETLGCLAGENVLFIACRSILDIHETYELVCEKLYFKRYCKEEEL